MVDCSQQSIVSTHCWLIFSKGNLSCLPVYGGNKTGICDKII